jgi:hypothetical protein
MLASTLFRSCDLIIIDLFCNQFERIVEMISFA